MTKYFLVLAFLGVMAVNAEENKNLHINPGVENGSKGFGKYLGKGKSRFGVTKELAKSGRKCVFLQCLKNGTSAALMFCGSDGYKPKTALDVIPGKHFSVKFAIKSNRPLSNLTYYILFWKKGDHSPKGRVVRSTLINLNGTKTSKLTTGTEWQDVKMRILVPAGVDKMDIAVQIQKGKPGDTIFVDDVSIVPEP